MYANQRTRGIQLLELTIAMVITSLLVSGMAASVLISSRAATLAAASEVDRDLTDGGLMRLRRDLQLASEVAGSATSSVRLNLNGSNGTTETRDYSWAGGGHPLRLSKNNGPQVAITSELDEFGLEWNNTKPAIPHSSFATGEQYEFVSHVVRHNVIIARSASIGVPATFQSGDLLVAAVAVGKNARNSLSINEGWTLCSSANSGGGVTLAVLSSTSDPSTLACSWSGFATSALCVAHFRRPNTEPVRIRSTQYEIRSFASQVRVGAMTNQPTGRLVVRAAGTDVGIIGLGDNVSGVSGCSVVSMSKMVGVVGLGLVFASRPGDLVEESFDFATAGRCVSISVSLGQ